MGYVSKKPPPPTAANKAASEAWRAWFDTKKTPITQALGIFRIVTDMDLEIENEDDAVPDIPFVLRSRQADALELIEGFFWKLKRRAARLVILKARRFGMTTFFLLLGLERILRVPGYQVLLVAQDDAMSRAHFQRLRDTFLQIPPFALAEAGIEIVKSTDQQIVLRHGQHKTSSFTVAPAKRQALGRGAQYHMLLLTEYPSWPKSAKSDLSGVLRSCRNVRGNCIVFESTARGYEDFHRRYTRAAKRRSDYRAMFIASYEHPGNRKPFDTVAAETAFIETIGKEKEYGAEDELVLFRKLTVDLRWPIADVAAFLNWRRSTLIDDCEGSIENLHREEPNTPDEAFSGTGIPMFRKEFLDAWRPFAEAREASALHGRLLDMGKEFSFVEDMRHDLTVFEKPEPGVRYGFGKDVASGIARLADGRTEADFSYQAIKRVDTRVTVARFRVHMPPAEFARAGFHLCCWYNGARGYIERAINDSGVCIDTFEDLEWGEFRGSELLLGQKVLIKTDAANVRANWRWTPGWKTTGKSKPKLVNNIEKEILRFGLPDGEKPCPYDLQFLDEGMRFERDDRTGKMEAGTGHDDGVIAEGLCLEACDVIEAEIQEDAPAKLPVSGLGILLKYAQLDAAQREQEAEGEITFAPGMDGF